jgi:hypothetical protein
MTFVQVVPRLFAIAILCGLCGFLWAKLTQSFGWSLWKSLLSLTVPLAIIHLFVVTGSATWVESDAWSLGEPLLTTKELRRFLHLGLLTPPYWSHWWALLWGTSCAVGVLIVGTRGWRHKDVSVPGQLPYWGVVSGLAALAISGAVAKDRVISRYVAEHVNSGTNDCGVTWNIGETDSTRVIKYWFTFPWEGCERAPLATKLSAGVLVASIVIAFVCIATRRAKKFQRTLILGTQLTVGSVALLCLVGVLRRYETIINEGGTWRDSLPLFKLEEFAFLLCCLVLCSFSIIFSEFPQQRLLWLPPLLGGLSAVRYLAENSHHTPYYWPFRTRPQLEHLAQDRWYLAAAGLSLVLAQMPKFPVRAKWRGVIVAVPVIILAIGTTVFAERVMKEAWAVKCLPYQIRHHVEECAGQ